MIAILYLRVRLILVFSIFIGCVPDLETLPDNNETNSDLILQIPDEFDFKTHEKVHININDLKGDAFYQVFAENRIHNPQIPDSLQINFDEVVKDDVIYKLKFSGVTQNGILRQNISIPSYLDKVFIRRKGQDGYTSYVRNINNGGVALNLDSSSTAEITSTISETVGSNYVVSGSGNSSNTTSWNEGVVGSFSIDVNGETKYLTVSAFNVNGLDPSGDSLMVIQTVNSQGLTDSGTLSIYFRPTSQSFTSNIKFSFWEDENFTTPLNSNIQITILDLDHRQKVQITNDSYNSYHTYTNSSNDPTRVTADVGNLVTEFQGFRDSTIDNPLNAVSILTNSQQVDFTFIHDSVYLAMFEFRNPSAVLRTDSTQDTDGDGVADIDDDYPNDDGKAFNNYSPNATDYGLLLFEDLWPSFGDYDFNDVALNYKTKLITNAQNEVVQVDIICQVKTSSSGFTNGVGIEFTGVDPNQIQSVSGPIYTEDYIENNSNGTESNQNNAVVILSDNADNLMNESTISIILTSPISTESLGQSPFNPFIISNKIREREIHLPNKPSTTLGTSAFENGGLNSDPSGNFISSQGFPWGLSFYEDIPTPKEGVRINDAYNLFNSWAISGGNIDKDWYKDKSGHRNTNFLED